jgi:chaperonin GroEL
MKKQIVGLEARESVLNGARQLYEAVSLTLGPKGRNFLIETSKGVELTHDGVTVAKSVEPNDPVEKLGADFIRKSSLKNNNLVGDGTTTTTILTYKLIEGFSDLLINPMQFARDLQVEAENLCAQIKPRKVDDLAQVATISCADPELGKIVAEAVGAVGYDGVVVVEPSEEVITETELVEGFKIDSGFISPYFINDADTSRTLFENVSVLVAGGSVSWNDIADVLQNLTDRKIVMIAPEYSKELIARMISLNLKGEFNSLLIKAPGFGNYQEALLEDISAVVNATFVKDRKPTQSDLGKADKVVADQDKTVITGNLNKDYLDKLKPLLNATDSQYDKKRIESRIANLEGKVSIIRVGGLTDVEITEKIYRVDDAVAACRAALEDGIVAGGAISYLNLKTSDTPAGNLFKNVLQEPFRHLMSNAGLDPELKLPNITDTKGYNVLEPDELVDMFEAGIVDPAKVVKEAIRTSASVASSIITIGGLVAKVKDED